MLFKYKKHKKNALSKKQKNELENFKNLLLTSPKQVVDIELEKIFNLSKNTNSVYKLFNTYYFVKQQGFFKGHNDVFLLYCFDSLIVQDYNLKNTLLTFIKKNKAEKNCSSELFIIGNSFDQNCFSLINLYDFKINLVELSDFYKYVVKDLNLYTYKAPKNKKVREKFNIFFKSFLNSKQHKKFLMLSFGFFLASFVVRYNIYYIVFSSVLFILAIICKLKPQKAP